MSLPVFVNLFRYLQMSAKPLLQEREYILKKASFEIS